MYTVHCLPSLTVLNGSAVTAAERSRAKAMFARVTTMRLRAAPKPHSEARRVSPESTPAGRASRAFVVEALKESLHAVDKVEALDQMWPGVALKLVEEGTLLRSGAASVAWVRERARSCAPFATASDARPRPAIASAPPCPRGRGRGRAAGIAASCLEGARASRPRRSSVDMHIAALQKTGAIT